MNPEQFQQALADRGINLTDRQMQQFADYYQLLVTTNRQVNLTRITEENDVYLKHFYDSLTGAFAEPRLQTEQLPLCDIGAGAGFPSLPLKIAFPQLQVTIVDSLNKRINFLQELVAKLGLSGVTLVHDRAETFSAKKAANREKYDLVLARAVDDELADAQGAISKLGGEVQKEFAMTLPGTADQRKIIIIDKVTATPPKYPRRPGLPNKKPL